MRYEVDFRVPEVCIHHSLGRETLKSYKLMQSVTTPIRTLTSSLVHVVSSHDHSHHTYSLASTGGKSPWGKAAGALIKALQFIESCGWQIVHLLTFNEIQGRLSAGTVGNIAKSVRPSSGVVEFRIRHATNAQPYKSMFSISVERVNVSSTRYSPCSCVVPYSNYGIFSSLKS
jgi:hypothetical protein